MGRARREPRDEDAYYLRLALARHMPLRLPRRARQHFKYQRQFEVALTVYVLRVELEWFWDEVRDLVGVRSEAIERYTAAIEDLRDDMSLIETIITKARDYKHGLI